MQPTQLIWGKGQSLLAADTASLAQTSGCAVHLSQSAFTPSLSLTLSGVTEANYSDYSVMYSAAGTQNNYVDAATGHSVVEMIAPSGGWVFSTSTSGGLPQTIYGFYLTNHAGSTLYGSATLSAPVTLTASGQAIELPPIRLTYSTSNPS